MVYAAASGDSKSGKALKIGLAAGIPCAAGLAAVGSLIWWCCLRRRKTSALSATASAKAHREIAAKEGNLLATEDIAFEKDDKGKRLLLGEGAFAKASHTLSDLYAHDSGSVPIPLAPLPDRYRPEPLDPGCASSTQALTFRTRDEAASARCPNV